MAISHYNWVDVDKPTVSPPFLHKNSSMLNTNPILKANLFFKKNTDKYYYNYLRPKCPRITNKEKQKREFYFIYLFKKKIFIVNY